MAGTGGDSWVQEQQMDAQTHLSHGSKQKLLPSAHRQLTQAAQTRGWRVPKESWQRLTPKGF